MRTERVTLSVIIAGAVLSVLMALYSAPRPILIDISLVAHTTGLLAGYGVAVMVVLMARVPVLERDIGADRMARWHGRGGRLILVLILVHAVAATATWAQVQGVGALDATVQVLHFPGLVAATVGTALFIAIGVLSARAARRRLSYETWHLIHLLTYVAIALSFAHELGGPDMAGLPVVQVFWSLLYTAAFGLLLRYRILDPLLRAIRHRLRVHDIIPEGPGVSSVIITGRHLDELRAESGQFFRWRFLSAATWRYANPFSLSAAPSDTFLRLTVKAVGASTEAIQALTPGVRVMAEGPYGAMTAKRHAGNGALLIAGGVGITPMRALFETIPVDGRRLTLLYRASSSSDVLFRDELEAIAAARGAQLLLVVGRSSDPNTALTPARLHATITELSRRDVFICASDRFSLAIRETLAEAGVPRRNIHQEDFAF